MAQAGDCEKFGTDNGSDASAAEFGQDWYLHHNFLRHSVGDGGRSVATADGSGGGSRRGVYVDVGASLPFDYSNTVVFDRCHGWEGVCVDPNPHLVPFLAAYRNCKLFRLCVDGEPAQEKAFSD